ncbi:MAG: hypothetical protein AABW92_05725 [Nanoarchaeota archaeon]
MQSISMQLSDLYYNALVGALSYFSKVPLYGEEYLPEKGPAIFAANHLSEKGPLRFIFSVNRRVHPWVISEMTNFQQSPDYLRKDFVEPVMHLRPPVSNAVSYAITRISVPLMKSLQPVPVYRRNTYGTLNDTMLQSHILLDNSRYLLIFPEDPDSNIVDEASGIKHFMKGYVRLAEQLYEEKKHVLSFYPVAILETGVHIGKPVQFDPDNSDRSKGLERTRIAQTLENEVIRLYHLH